MNKPKIVVFASGGAGTNEGGSGFQKIAEHAQLGNLSAEIVAAISNHPQGGIHDKAQKLGIPFEHIEKPYTADKYLDIIKNYQANLIALSGYIKLVEGLDPTKCINIHPGPLGEYGGKGMYGHHVHQKIYEDFKAGKIKRTCVTMHFVTSIYDDPQGLIFQYPVELEESDTPETIAKKVNTIEHERQWEITDMVAKEEISATRDEETQKILIKFPKDYTFNCPVSLDKEDPYEDF